MPEEKPVFMGDTNRDTDNAASRLNTNNRAQSTNSATRRDTARAKGKQSGGIYDLSTTYYEPLPANPQTGKRNLQDDGIDFVGRDRSIEDGGGGGGTFELDVVKDNNTAGRASFTGGGVI